MKQLILCIDIQNEYITNGRPYNIKNINSSLENARVVIEAARKSGISVWHMRHENEKNAFVKGTSFADFIVGFEPQLAEKHFIKNMYSCFSSPEFVRQLAEDKPEEIIIIGYGSSMCCTCTIIDGIHRGYQFTLIEDATASRSFPHATEEEMHYSAINILTQYSKIIRTDDLVGNLERSVNLECVV